MMFVSTFAFGIEAAIGIVFLLISVIGWLGKLVNERNSKPANRVLPRRQNPRVHNTRFQNEIDLFLNDVDDNQPPEEIGIELVPEDEIRQRRQQDPGLSEIGTLGGRTLDSSRLGSGIERSVNQHMREESVNQHMREESVTEYVSKDLDGRFAAFEATTKKTKAPTTHKHLAKIVRREDTRKLIRRLHSPDGVRQAILISEILNPCRGHRPRK